MYPDWLDFHTRSIGGAVVNIRSRSGVVRVEAGEGETADRVAVGIPDDGAWATFSGALDKAGFWEWTEDTRHHEPHRPGDRYWWLEVRLAGREHRAAAWNDAPDGLEQVREALNALIEQVSESDPYRGSPSPSRA